MMKVIEVVRTDLGVKVLQGILLGSKQSELSSWDHKGEKQ